MATGTTLILSTPLPAGQIPAAGDVFALGERGEVAQRCIITEIRHLAGSELAATIKLQPYVDAIHTADTGPIPTYDPIINQPTPFERRGPSTPRVIAVRKEPYDDPDSPSTLRKVLIVASLSTPTERRPQALRYRYRLRGVDAEGWNHKGDVAATSDYEVEMGRSRWARNTSSRSGPTREAPRPNGRRSTLND